MTAFEPLVSAGPGTIEAPELETTDAGTGGAWIVTVYDNEYNTWNEVMSILMLATQCTVDEAYNETWEVHHLGQSVVHHGAEEECQKVAEIIATIGIRVTVTEEG